MKKGTYKYLFTLLTVFTLAFCYTGYTQDSSASVDQIEANASVMATAAATPVAVDSPVVIGAEITHENISQTYLAWFASPGMFLMLIIIITGIVVKAAPNLSAFAKQATSWLLGIILGISASLLGFGMFTGLSILDAGILGLVSSGFSNVLYSTGAFDAILGIPKKA